MWTSRPQSTLQCIGDGLRSRWARRVWPGHCEVCRSWSGTSFCASCTALYDSAPPRCPRCAASVGSDEGATPCRECHGQEPPFVRVRVAFDYAFPWDGLIQQLKFADRTELARPLAEALSQRILRGWASEHAHRPQARIDALVPMPLSPGRLVERGYNQALLLARHVARLTGTALDSTALLRPIEALHQADLTRAQRQQNLRGVFMLDPAARARIQGRRLALIDDVITTGSTAAEATRELLRGGARDVEVWAVAHTPRH